MNLFHRKYGKEPLKLLSSMVMNETGVGEAYVLLIMDTPVQPVIRNYQSFMVRLPIALFMSIISFLYLQSMQNTALIQFTTFGLCALIVTQLLIFAMRILTRLGKFGKCSSAKLKSKT